MEELAFKAIGDYGALAVVGYMAYILWQISGNHLNHIQTSLDKLLLEIVELRKDIQEIFKKIE